MKGSDHISSIYRTIYMSTKGGKLIPFHMKIEDHIGIVVDIQDHLVNGKKPYKVEPPNTIWLTRKNKREWGSTRRYSCYRNKKKIPLYNFIKFHHIWNFLSKGG